MKMTKIFATLVLAAATLSIVVSCSDDEGSKLSKKVIVVERSLSFDANAGSQTITVYADEDWVMLDYPDWVTVSPNSGSRVTDVTVSVTANYVNGVVATPRSTTLTFMGGIIDSIDELDVYQDGDEFYGVVESTVEQIYGLDDYTSVIMDDVIVAAAGTDGFIIADPDFGSFVYVEGESSVSVGDELSIRGQKTTSTSNMAQIILSSCETVSTGNSVTYPTPTDITDTLDSYSSSTWDYINVTGYFASAPDVLTVSSATYNVNVLNTEAINGSLIGGRSVTLTGFYAGTAAPYVGIFVTEASAN